MMNRTTPKRAEAPDLASRIQQMYNCPESMDVEFIFPSHDDKCIKAHRVVLSIISPVFNEMLFAELKTHTKFQVNDCEPSVFQQIIDCAYLKPINFNVPVSELAGLTELAHKYQIENVVDKIEAHLVAKCSVGNVCELFEISRNLDLARLNEVCVRLFQTQTRQILRTQDFINAPASTVNFIYGLEELTVNSEMELCEALEKWVARKKDGSVLDSIELVDEAICSIRFLTFDVKILCELPLLTPEERLALISNKFDDDEDFTPIPMPVRLSKRRDKRARP